MQTNQSIKQCLRTHPYQKYNNYAYSIGDSPAAAQRHASVFIPLSPDLHSSRASVVFRLCHAFAVCPSHVCHVFAAARARNQFGDGRTTSGAHPVRSESSRVEPNRVGPGVGLAVRSRAPDTVTEPATGRFYQPEPTTSGDRASGTTAGSRLLADFHSRRRA